MCGRLLEQFGDLDGAALIHDVLNPVMSNIMEILHRYDGDPVKSAGMLHQYRGIDGSGDSVLVLFEGAHWRQAFQAALDVLRLFQNLTLDVPAWCPAEVRAFIATVRMGCHATLGYGLTYHCLLGDPSKRVEYLLASPRGGSVHQASELLNQTHSSTPTATKSNSAIQANLRSQMGL